MHSEADNKRYLFGQELARIAGERAKHFFDNRESLIIEKKSHDFDLLSAADKNVELLIRSKIESYFPKDAIIGEEKGVSGARDSEYVWIVDPIDGTYPFLYGMPLWCVSIALFKNGEPLMGFVMDPNQGELFHAHKGFGAFCNDKPIKVMEVSHLNQGSIAVGCDNGIRAQYVKRFLIKLLDQDLHFCRPISCALTMAWVAAGRLMAAWYPYVRAWDWAGGLVIVEEAGGQTSHPLNNDGIRYGNAILASAKGTYNAIYHMIEMDNLLKEKRPPEEA
ncbi:MAG: inositol monophosphatase family protein [Alphaproteobacteria bacterium]